MKCNFGTVRTLTLTYTRAHRFDLRCVCSFYYCIFISLFLRFASPHLLHFYYFIGLVFRCCCLLPSCSRDVDAYFVYSHFVMCIFKWLNLAEANTEQQKQNKKHTMNIQKKMLWQKEAKIPTLEELRSKINLQKQKENNNKDNKTYCYQFVLKISIAAIVVFGAPVCYFKLN